MNDRQQLASLYTSKTARLNFPKNVLVVEEDDLNRWLVSRLLEPKGYVVSTVTNGPVAVAAAAQGSFDLILMNVHMTCMDGLAATQAIRQRELQTETYVPIIGMTPEGGATKALRYWHAGMDSYLAKPIQTDEFYRTIEAVLALHARLSQAEQLPAVFNCEEALHRLGNNVELLQQSAARFLTTAPHLVSAMRRAIAKGDPYNLDFAAHRMRGTASNISAHAVVELAERLELIGSVRNMTHAEATLAIMEAELERFKVAFTNAQQKLTAQPLAAGC